MHLYEDDRTMFCKFSCPPPLPPLSSISCPIQRKGEAKKSPCTYTNRPSTKGQYVQCTPHFTSRAVINRWVWSCFYNFSFSFLILVTWELLIGAVLFWTWLILIRYVIMYKLKTISLISSDGVATDSGSVKPKSRMTEWEGPAHADRHDLTPYCPIQQEAFPSFLCILMTNTLDNPGEVWQAEE